MSMATFKLLKMVRNFFRLSSSTYLYLFPSAAKTETDNLKRLLLPDGAPIDGQTDTYQQETSYKRKSEHGSPLQILPSIIIMHAKFSTVGLQLGLSKVPRFKNGRRMVLYCGSAAIVCHSPLLLFSGH